KNARLKEDSLRRAADNPRYHSNCTCLTANATHGVQAPEALTQLFARRFYGAAALSFSRLRSDQHLPLPWLSPTAISLQAGCQMHLFIIAEQFSL
ncbi:MAG: hypothetical protein IKU17_08185, partial [Clostridia bacterium]|nr:hypothetical protein [Clostridia bacterium]